MLVFGGLGGRVQDLVSLDLAHNGQGMDGAPPGADHGGAQLFDLGPPLFHLLGFVLLHVGSPLLV